DLANASLAQQGEGVAPRTNEDEFRIDDLSITSVQVLGVDLPVRTAALNLGDFVSITDFGARSASCGQKLPGQRTEVHVGTHVGPGDSNLPVIRTSAAHQR